jgi:hypothetical protein
MLRKLIWIEKRHFQGCGCSECSWAFKPSGPPAGDSLDEMKEIFERLRDKEFAMHVCAEHPRPRRQKAKVRPSLLARVIGQVACSTVTGVSGW